MSDGAERTRAVHLGSPQRGPLPEGGHGSPNPVAAGPPFTPEDVLHEVARRSPAVAGKLVQDRARWTAVVQAAMQAKLAARKQGGGAPPDSAAGTQTPPREALQRAPSPERAGQGDEWLQQLEPAQREVFVHLAAHGVVTDAEVSRMLGGPRAARRFALSIDSLRGAAPFGVRIDFVGGIKRYVREGSHR